MKCYGIMKYQLKQSSKKKRIYGNLVYIISRLYYYYHINRVKIIAGKFGDKMSRVTRSTPLSYFHVKMDPKTSWKFSSPSDHHCFVYVLDGEGIFDEKSKSIIAKQQANNSK
jgi:redox-sensitive bicupin YhaK (pirin superfamily)